MWKGEKGIDVRRGLLPSPRPLFFCARSTPALSVRIGHNG